MANEIFDSSTIALQGLDASCLSNGGRQVSPDLALSSLGLSKQVAALSSNKPTLVLGAIQKSARGIVQDPAGAAVGVNQKPASQAVGGASEAIYGAFPDLDPIPSMPVGASVFNTSTGPGRRVLHTYSPMLQGTPANAADCQTALEQLANAYANALNAANHPPAALASSADAALLNLVPISGNIFAGSFKDQTINHLHPSYTLTAIAIAQAALAASRQPLLPVELYYFDSAAYEAAECLIDRAYSALSAGQGR